jgi:hypothetical protein
VGFEVCDLRDIDALRRAFAGLRNAIGPARVLVTMRFRDLKTHSKAKTPVDKISTAMRRTVGALRRKAKDLGIGLGHRR